MSEILSGDVLPGAPHPREQTRLFGHSAVEADLLGDFHAGRLPHALLIGGPEGIGKATLAYRLARTVLAGGTEAGAHDLSLPASHPVFRQVASMSHPDLLVLRRAPEAGEEKIPTVIPAEMVRRVRSFFGATAAAGGWRVCIVDAVDELNAFGANALLKTLEEPPPRALFLLISHAPGRVLPTIRSRTRLLRLRPLASPDVLAALDHLKEAVEDLDAAGLPSAAEASGGSVRRALVLARGEGMEVRSATLRALEQLPRPRPEDLHALGARLQGDRADGLDLFIEAVSDYVAARATQEGEARHRLVRLGEVWEKVRRSALEADIYNLDRKALVFRIFADLAEAVR
ncbi:DNA polymerase III subunit delta' [Xanthobacter dioxanivorans]|uniref:DNA polymerase III subunit delta n=1 Tax=Xanthobacter dioxanivorans TaxID=2528964 RepID=A0A974SGR4_9HYPH|nr:DNA polymerase III subunit delta' [Xanthobacter dioxanivorans]QRG05531.1 DNA polymerase III subunit delta' [Xanthobacter dioxanivorans]